MQNFPVNTNFASKIRASRISDFLVALITGKNVNELVFTWPQIFTKQFTKYITGDFNSQYKFNSIKSTFTAKHDGKPNYDPT